MAERTLSAAQLNRALLDRQLLLDRAPLTVEEALVQVGGLQTQYAPSGYVGLWTRLRDFARQDLTRALEERRAVQATLMRSTIHLVAAAEYWRYAVGIRRARREWAARVPGLPPEAELQARGRQLRAALADGPRTVKELGDLASGFLGNLALWVDLVRVPPSGNWERRRADRLALADAWLGPEDVPEEEARAHLVQAYLRGFEPASWRNIASWAGASVDAVREAGASVDLVRYRDAAGRELVDLARGTLPDPDVRAPVRFLAHWDNALLVHARRTGLLPEEHRGRVFSTKNPFSVGTVLVDGRVVAAWRSVDGRVVVEPFEPVDRRAADALEAERAALETFHA
jgi:hypothetical protein